MWKSCKRKWRTNNLSFHWRALGNNIARRIDASLKLRDNAFYCYRILFFAYFRNKKHPGGTLLFSLHKDEAAESLTLATSHHRQKRIHVHWREENSTMKADARELSDQRVSLKSENSQDEHKFDNDFDLIKLADPFNWKVWWEEMKILCIVNKECCTVISSGALQNASGDGQFSFRGTFHCTALC